MNLPQQMPQMPHDDTGLMKWVVGALFTAGAAVTGFFFNRLDKKVNKDSFDEYTEGHKELHNKQETTSNDIKASLARIETIIMERRDTRRNGD